MRTFFLLFLWPAWRSASPIPCGRRFGKADRHVAGYAGRAATSPSRCPEGRRCAGRVDLEMTAPAPRFPRRRGADAGVDRRQYGAGCAADFAAGRPRDTPQNAERIYSQSAGAHRRRRAHLPVPARAGRCRGHGCRLGRHRAAGRRPRYDARIPPIGWALSALGFVGLVLAVRRRRPAVSADRPPRRWGRGAAP